MAGTESVKIRARNALGQFIPDNPTTPSVDEAWVQPVDIDTTGQETP